MEDIKPPITRMIVMVRTIGKTLSKISWIGPESGLRIKESALIQPRSLLAYGETLTVINQNGKLTVLHKQWQGELVIVVNLKFSWRMTLSGIGLLRGFPSKSYDSVNRHEIIDETLIQECPRFRKSLYSWLIHPKSIASQTHFQQLYVICEWNRSKLMPQPRWLIFE